MIVDVLLTLIVRIFSVLSGVESSKRNRSALYTDYLSSNHLRHHVHGCLGKLSIDQCQLAIGISDHLGKSHSLISVAQKLCESNISIEADVQEAIVGNLWKVLEASEVALIILIAKGLPSIR